MKLYPVYWALADSVSCILSWHLKANMASAKNKAEASKDTVATLIFHVPSAD